MAKSTSRKPLNLDQQLRDTTYIKENSWGKLLTYLKRQFDQWVMDKLGEHGYTNFKIAHMPVVMNISVDGTNNNDLAKAARVTKQAMSKVLKELIELGYVTTQPDPRDKRSAIVLLTEKGKRFVLAARTCVEDLSGEYKTLLGEKNYDAMVNSMKKIIEYNENRG